MFWSQNLEPCFKKPTFINQKNRPKSWPNTPWHPRAILLFQSHMLNFLNLARSAAPHAILKLSDASKRWILPNFRIFHFMTLTWNPLKLFPRNFSEADICTIWNYIMKSQTGQKENQNEWQTSEHRPKTWNFRTKKIRPNLDQQGRGAVEQYCFSSLVFKETVSTRHIHFKPCAQRRTPRDFQALRRIQTLNFTKIFEFFSSWT